MAGHLGRTVAQLEQGLSARELREWQEYDAIEPFGPWRDNWHAALIASLLANANRRPNSPPIKMAEFFYTDPITQQVREEDEMFAAIFAASTPATDEE